MTTTTQQLPSNPALDFANAVLAETDGGREIVLMLHDIAQGVRENATANDRINATNILMDRGLGKCPKQRLPAGGSPNLNPAQRQAEEPRRTQVPQARHPARRLPSPVIRPSKGPTPDTHTADSQSPESGGISDSTGRQPRHLQNLSTLLLSRSTFSKSPTTA